MLLKFHSENKKNSIISTDISRKIANNHLASVKLELQRQNIYLENNHSL